MQSLKSKREQVLIGIIVVLALIILGFLFTQGDSGSEKVMKEGDEAMEEVMEESAEVPAEEAAAPATTTKAAPAPTTQKSTPSYASCQPSLRGSASSELRAVTLNWTACSSDDFQFYKLVRSTTNPRPVYPGGAEQFSSSNIKVTNYVDKGVAPYNTYHYTLCVVERLGKITCSNSVKVDY